jgi:hypothetical protein
VEFDVVHPSTEYLRFILGGRDENRYPGFNGLFTRVFYSIEDGAFVDSVEQLNSFLKLQGPRPSEILEKLTTTKVVKAILDTDWNDKEGRTV